jgi:hypothetical protein
MKKDLVRIICLAAVSGFSVLSLLSTGEAQTLTPSSLSFSVGVGYTSNWQAVTLTNDSSTTLTGISYSTSAPFGISSKTSCTSTLDAGKSCRIKVTFSPTQVGTVTGTLTVTDSANSSPQTVSLSGTGEGGAKLAPSSLSFGVTEVGDTSKPLNASLFAEIGHLTGISYSTTGPFAIYSSTCGTTLRNPGGCSIRITFSPTESGNATGALNVTDDVGTQTVSLTGTGTTEAVYASPSSVDFGDASVGTTTNPTRISLFNEGSEDITVTSVSASGNFAVITDYCLDGVKANSHCDVDVVFSPTQTGALSGTLTFVDNATNSPQTVSLSGTGD